MRYGTGGWAIDGALACIVKTFLVVRQADSSVKWLPSVWPNVKGQMDLVIAKFDTEGDGVITGAQQNTYDTAMYGANTFIGSYYVTALRACSAMAELMGDAEVRACVRACVRTCVRTCVWAKMGLLRAVLVGGLGH